MDQNQEIFARYMNDKDFQQLVAEYLRKQVYDQIRSAADRCSAVQPVLDARVLPFILSWLDRAATCTPPTAQGGERNAQVGSSLRFRKEIGGHREHLAQTV